MYPVKKWGYTVLGLGTEVSARSSQQVVYLGTVLVLIEGTGQQVSLLYYQLVELNLAIMKNKIS